MPLTWYIRICNQNESVLNALVLSINICNDNASIANSFGIFINHVVKTRLLHRVFQLKFDVIMEVLIVFWKHLKVFLSMFVEQ
jgi:hypothetical protein